MKADKAKQSNKETTTDPKTDIHRTEEPIIAIPRIPFSDTLILALITGFAYAISIAAQKGYLAAFNIPPQFMDFGSGSVVDPELLRVVFPMVLGAVIALNDKGTLAQVLLPLGMLCVLLYLILVLWLKLPIPYAQDFSTFAQCIWVASMVTLYINYCLSYLGKSVTRKQLAGLGSCLLSLAIFLPLLLTIVQGLSQLQAKHGTVLSIACIAESPLSTRPATTQSTTQQYIVVKVNGERALCVTADEQLNPLKDVRVFDLKELSIQRVEKK